MCVETNFLIQNDYIISKQSIKIVRDDIFPFVGGGSKARKAVAYEQFLRENGYNAVVTCGGVQSNHNRAMALMCAKNGWKCHLCIQGIEERFLSEKGNALLDRLSGAECELIRPEDTSAAMDRAMDKLKAEAAKWATQEEDVLTYAMFPQVAPKFFDKRNAKKQGVDGDHVDYTNQSHPV